MGIEKWSTTAANNATADPPINWAEGMLPSQVNDSARSMMAAIRAWGEDGSWMNFGDTCTYASATTFTVPTDLRARYHVNRRVRAVGSSTGTIYGTITASSYSNPNTTVTVKWDSGALSNESLAVSLGPDATGWPAVAVGHRSTLKAWVRFSPASATIISSYNVAGITQNSAGVWTITFERDMADTNYAMIGTAGNFLGNTAHYDVQFWSGSAVNTSSVRISVGSISGTSNWIQHSGGDYVAVLILGDY